MGAWNILVRFALAAGCGDVPGCGLVPDAEEGRLLRC